MSIEEITDDDLAVSKKTNTKWKSSTICGTASQKCGTAPQKVEQVLEAGHCFTNCGIVPQKVAQLLLNVACYFKMWNSVPLLIAYHMVVDRHTHHYSG